MTSTTKSDLTRLKQEVNKRFDSLEDRITTLDSKIVTLEDKVATKVDMARLELEMNEKFEKLENNTATKDDFRKVMTVLDKVLKEVLAMRQEQSMHVGDHIRINDRLKTLAHSSI